MQGHGGGVASSLWSPPLFTLWIRSCARSMAVHLRTLIELQAVRKRAALDVFR